MRAVDKLVFTMCLLVVPATYVLDRDGQIVLAFVDPDYRRRLEPAAAIAALRKVKVAETT